MMETEDVNIDVIIKLGGSAITDKNSLETVKPDALVQAADIVKTCVEKRLKCVVVHGAGSYGHHQAKKFGVKQGFHHLSPGEAATTRLGFCYTRQSVLKLNGLVMDALLSVGIPAVSCHPCGHWSTDDGRLKESDIGLVRKLLLAGFTPVLHGDAVLDSQRGCTILSGDTIIKSVCKEISPTRVVFLTDVDGVFDQPPTEPGARLLRHILVLKTGELQPAIRTSSHQQDVTGGIQLKLDSAVDIVLNSHGQISVWVCRLSAELDVKSICTTGCSGALQHPGTLFCFVS